MSDKVLVIGAARSGIAASKLLVRHGYEVILTDMNEIENKEELLSLGITIYDKGHPEALKNEEYTFVVKNPGIKYTVPFVKYFVDHKVPIFTEVEIGYRFAKKFHYGAVTGTNGKTTITTMLYEMLKYNDKAIVAGNIGYPLSELALRYETEEKDVALELSNFQLLGIDTFAPSVSVVCNLAPDHLDYMPNVESYYASKMIIYENCKEDDWFLRNVDDETVMQYAKNIPCTVIDFSLKRSDVDLYRKDGAVYLHNTMLFEEKTLPVVGEYNICNAMIASCMAYKLGVSIPDIQKAIANFKPVEHRLEYIGEKNGVRFYNDSKATNTHAVTAALKSFEKNIILLAGGHDKGISFDDLKQFDEKVKLCVAFGETREQFKEIFHHVITKETMEEALQEAIAHSETGDVILLSPACSSYDQFPNYEIRGKLFKEMVNTWLHS
ncbi:UDP-N-acetylmuramoyl-L-alanine--D-glutamate ligase [Erysipelotrichaceae bacterium HCN-30851]